MDNKKGLPMSVISIIVVLALSVAAVACAVFFSKKKNDASFEKTADEAVITSAVSEPGINTVTPVVTAPVQDEIEMDETGRYRTLKSIKGAQVIDNSEWPLNSLGSGSAPPYDYIYALKKTTSIVGIGSISDISMVKVEEGHYTHYISTFSLKISEGIKNCEDNDEFKVTTISSFSYSYQQGSECEPFNTLRYGDSFPGKAEGLYIIRKIDNDLSWIVGDAGKDYDKITTIKPIDYADYYLSSYFKSDGRTFKYWDEEILLDDIRVDDGIYRLLPEGDIVGLTVTDDREEFEYSITDIDRINAIKDFFDELNLTQGYDDRQIPQNSLYLLLKFTYSDRSGEQTVCFVGDTCLKPYWSMLRFEIEEEQGKKLKELLELEEHIDLDYYKQKYEDAAAEDNEWAANSLPSVLLIDGDCYIVIKDMDEDFSEYVVGEISSAVSDRKMPEKNGETNFRPFLGCKYAYKDGKYYLYYIDHWCELYSLSQEERMYIAEKPESREMPIEEAYDTGRTMSVNGKEYAVYKVDPYYVLTNWYFNPYDDYNTLFEDSDLVVSGSFIDDAIKETTRQYDITDCRYKEYKGFSHNTFKIDKVYKGSAESDTITIRQENFIDEENQRIITYSELTPMIKGDKWLYFLKKGGDEGTYFLRGDYSCRYPLDTEITGGKVLAGVYSPEQLGVYDEDTFLSVLPIYREIVNNLMTSEKKDNIYFYSRNDSDVKEYIIGKKEELIIVVGLDNNIDSGIEIGVPISVRNTSGLYYVPFFYEGRCIHIANVLRTDNSYSMSSGKMFADVLNRLDSGNYYFEADTGNNIIYLKGNNIKIAIDGNFPKNYDNIGNDEKDIVPEKDELSVDIFDSFLS